METVTTPLLDLSAHMSSELYFPFNVDFSLLSWCQECEKECLYFASCAFAEMKPTFLDVLAKNEFIVKDMAKVMEL